jgi:ubiquinol-cytochrome c reductase iron-sulfur subunit
MSDDTPREDKPTTSADVSGSALGRFVRPGSEQAGTGTASAREIEGELVGMAASPEAVAPSARPRRRVGRRSPERTEQAQLKHDAMMSRPDQQNDEAQIVSQEESGEPLDPAQYDAQEESFAEQQVSALFLVAILATIGFIVCYVLVDQHENYGQEMNWALGGTLAASLFGIGAGMVLWAKKLMPHDKAVQERHPFHSPEEEELEAEEIFFKGVQASGLGTHKLLRRTLVGAMALFPLPLVLMLRDLGPLPGNSLRVTGWKKGSRLVDLDTKIPVKLGDIDIGGIQTVMPEGFTTPDEFALAPSIIIRFAPGQVLSSKELNWGVDNHVVYSKVCTHAGCPISLYEQQTHHLLCPCHQSTFQMNEDAKVIFGPAARPLPQLQIYVDDAGYFRAKGDYSQPVGPSFWERKG